jgi:hypothetical protein
MDKPGRQKFEAPITGIIGMPKLEGLEKNLVYERSRMTTEGRRLEVKN